MNHMEDKVLTIRQQIIQLLKKDWHTIRDLSQTVRIKEKEVLLHLKHVEKSTSRENRFRISPSECQKCGYEFKERRQYHKPSKCPKCRNTFISVPQFKIE